MENDYVCRVCESASNLEVLFKKENRRLLVMLRYVACVSVESDDLLPRCICLECAKKLQEAFIFKRLCKNTDQKWRKIITSQKKSVQLPTANGEISETILLVTTPIDLPSIDVEPTRPETIDQHHCDDSVADQVDIPVKSEVINESPPEPSTIEPEKDTPEQPRKAVRGERNLLVALKRVNVSKYIKTPQTANSASKKKTGKRKSLHKANDKEDVPAEKRSALREDGDNNCQVEQGRSPEAAQARKVSNAGEKETSVAPSSNQSNYNHTSPGRSSCNGRLQTSQEKRKREAVLKCDTCGEKFTESFCLEQHLMLHSTPKFKCESCGKEFARSSALKQHQLSHTNSQAFRKSIEMRPTEKLPDSSPKPIRCDKCDRTFTFAMHFHQHRKTHKDEIAQSVVLNEHPAKNSSQEAYVCATCNTVFSDKDALKQHRSVHMKPRPFKCGECPKTFNRSRELKEHRLWHSNPKVFACKPCGRNFNRHSHLREHKSVHQTQSIFKCHLCGEVFRHKASLSRHVMQHRPVDVFKTRRLQMKLHRSSHTN